MAQKIYRSPVICYEVTEDNNSFCIDVYYEKFRNSDNNELCCRLKNFSSSKEKAHQFAIKLAQNSALPLHVPELAEEFLSLQFTFVYTLWYYYQSKLFLFISRSQNEKTIISINDSGIASVALCLYQ